jgi:hypothetical protein
MPAAAGGTEADFAEKSVTPLSPTSNRETPLLTSAATGVDNYAEVIKSRPSSRRALRAYGLAIDIFSGQKPGGHSSISCCS